MVNTLHLRTMHGLYRFLHGLSTPSIYRQVWQVDVAWTHAELATAHDPTSQIHGAAVNNSQLITN